MPEDDWPFLIICGPILRRVEPGAVTVWVALQSPRLVTLRVYQEFPHGQVGSGRPLPRLIGSRRTLRLGARLHVACITAKPSGQFPNDPTLKPGILYHYDLEFNPEGASGPVDEYDNNLSKEGLLSEDLRTTTLGYGDGILPSFALPPNDLTKVRIIQGSCRKPHAPGIDALSILDDALVTTHDKPLDRPHQLFLTGDQIYADDVGAALLKELTAVGTRLLGWTETIPGVNRPLTDPSLAPEKRQDVVSNWALFRSDHAWNHLLGLGEFYAMYLMAWSDELWPRTLTRSEQPSSRRQLATDRDILGDQVIDEYEALLNGLFASPYEEVIPRVREARANLEEFQNTLPQVRRVLANVPTYMMFDDHEVTDDWYLNGLFAREILDPGNHLARRILTNALTSFSIFQAWGNTPERFETGPGQQLLQAASGWDGQDTTKVQSLAKLVGIVDWGKPQPPDRLLFDFSLTGPKHHVIVLDTRTWRSFGGDKEPAELISDAALIRQLTDQFPNNPNSEVVLVISPAPVLGLRLLEEWIQPVVAELSDAFAADLEAWKANEKSFQRLLRALGQGRKVVLLSGDVHYGFSAVCEFFDDTGRSAIYAQLTSSALKNEDPKMTVLLHQFGHFVDLIGPPREFVCWNNDPLDNLRINLISPIVVSIGPGVTSNGYALAQVAKAGRPAVVEPTWVQNANKAPQWSYRLRFLSETRDHPHPKRTANAPPPVQLPPTSPDRSSYLSWYRRIAPHHVKYLNDLGSGRWIVGYNNLGEITFNANPLKVFHRLWWRLEGDPEPAPLTQYEIDLTNVGPKPTVRVE